MMLIDFKGSGSTLSNLIFTKPIYSTNEITELRKTNCFIHSGRCLWGLKGVFGASGREFSGWEDWAGRKGKQLNPWDHAGK